MTAGYKGLEIYQRARELSIRVHAMTLTLPSFERFEEGSPIRRSSKSVSSNIVEGYALRKYKNEFVHYLFRAYGSSEETMEHLELLHDSKSLNDDSLFQQLHRAYDSLCGKILRYIQAVDQRFDVPNFMKESVARYTIDNKSYDQIIPPTQTTNP